MKFSSCDDFCELLHVRRFDVHNIKTLILDIKVPKVDPEIVAAYERFPVAIDGNAVNVVRMRVGVGPPRHGRHNGIMMRHSWELQHGWILERYTGRTGSPSTTDTRRGQLAREVVLCNNLQ